MRHRDKRSFEQFTTWIATVRNDGKEHENRDKAKFYRLTDKKFPERVLLAARDGDWLWVKLRSFKSIFLIVERQPCREELIFLSRWS